jgi:DNA-binding CsgD family transcriptional regulator
MTESTNSLRLSESTGEARSIEKDPGRAAPVATREGGSLPEGSIAIAAASLSPREREIARMVAMGYTNKTIAAVLEISTWTVGTHIRRVFSKLGVHSRSAMVAQLLAVGQITADAPDWAPLWRDALPSNGTSKNI